jgi:hypothetical protein
MKPRFVFLFTTLLACSNATENPPEGIACTLIGCSNGLSVEVTGTAGARATVEVRASGQTTQTFECVAGQPCRGFLENYMPDQATVTIRLADRTVERSVTPQYRLNRPNGANCPPECRQATVQVAV